ncbi:MAG: hypothetical protein IJC88_03805 [Oscillospiraceae bacterium]|nr:hypothetical protein [Oscillospiraceae bacterium]
MKKLVCLIFALGLFVFVSGCGKTKILTCDGCGAQVEVSETSNMTDDWIVFCAECDDIDLENA